MLTVPVAALRSFAGQLDRRAATLPSDAGEAARRQLAGAYFHLGKQMDEAGMIEEGLACYRKALPLADSNPALCFDILFKLERLNRVDEAWDALQALERTTGAPCATGHIMFALKARLEYRRGNAERSCSMLKQFLAEAPGDHPQRFLARGWLGTALDETGRYGAAMDAFDAKNEALLHHPATTGLLYENDAQLEALDEKLRWYANRSAFGWERAPASESIPAPVLLVGFPRSGTTLLDQLLDAHPSLSVIEERPTLDGIAERFSGSAEKLAALENMNEKEADGCRRRYRENVSAFLGGTAGGGQVVDKLPLNITQLDIYARLFPAARFIVALRDPRDVVLSNYMQLYKLNSSMAANLELARSARYYAAVMGLYLQLRRLMPDNIHEVRYESVVDDFESEVAQIMSFLGLEWDERVQRFHENAQQRWIATPSYHQASKPVYRSSVGRWTHYRDRMEPVMPLLRPYIEAFGY